MSEEHDLAVEASERLRQLQEVEKAVKKPSSLSFVERQDLARRASRARAGLEAALQGPESSDGEASAEEAPDPQAALTEALTEAAKVLDAYHAAQPAGLKRPMSARGRPLPGGGRRGAQGGGGGHIKAAGRGE